MLLLCDIFVVVREKQRVYAAEKVTGHLSALHRLSLDDPNEVVQLDLDMRKRCPPRLR